MAYVTVVVQSRLVDAGRIARGSGDGPRRAARRKVFFVITLPIIAPAMLSGWLLAFTLSLDDLVIASFAAGPVDEHAADGDLLQGPARRQPEINALPPSWSAVVTMFVVAAGILMARQEKARQRDTQMAAGRGRSALQPQDLRLRAPILDEFRMKVLGIDVGGSSIKGGAGGCVDAARSSARATCPRRSPPSPEAVMKQVAVLGQQLPGARAGRLRLPERGEAQRGAHRRQRRSRLDRHGRRGARECHARPAHRVSQRRGCRRPRRDGWGAGRDTPGTVIMLTFGTGIGTALFAMASCCRTPSSDTSRCTAPMPSAGPPRACAPSENLDFPAWIARVNEYLRSSMRCSGPTSSFSAAPSASVMTSSRRC